MAWVVIVAPLVGAWIEIQLTDVEEAVKASLLSWERGLKSEKQTSGSCLMSRSSRGSVD